MSHESSNLRHGRCLPQESDITTSVSVSLSKLIRFSLRALLLNFICLRTIVYLDIMRVTQFHEAISGTGTSSLFGPHTLLSEITSLPPLQQPADTSIRQGDILGIAPHRRIGPIHLYSIKQPRRWALLKTVLAQNLSPS
jgi:hypothetical protein